jgi:hypothetical protein
MLAPLLHHLHRINPSAFRLRFPPLLMSTASHSRMTSMLLVAPVAPTKATSVSKPSLGPLHKTRGAEYEVVCADSQAEVATRKREPRHAKPSSKAYRKALKYPRCLTFILSIRKAQTYEDQQHYRVDEISERPFSYAHMTGKRAEETRIYLIFGSPHLAGVFLFHISSDSSQCTGRHGIRLTARSFSSFLQDTS